MSGDTVRIRAAEASDDDAIWRVLEPMIRTGETYPLPRDLTKAAALAYWRSPRHAVFVAQDGEAPGGAHVANCGYVVAPQATGRGVARAMCAHSLERARERGFRAMQFNFVISSNERAVQLWQSCGFAIVGTLPGAFAHPARGLVDAYVMYRAL
jgi:ribosomal protein S18 acetylase RimI-like enzyme